MNHEARPVRRAPLERHVTRESSSKSLAFGPAQTHPEYARPPSHETLDRARFALQVATAGDRTPAEAWLSLTDEDRAALGETRAWHESELARLRREHPDMAEAMPPPSERGMRWRVGCSKLPPNEQHAALRIDEHERAAAQLAASQRTVAPVIRYRRELMRAYRIAVARRRWLRSSLSAKHPARSRPRSRSRRLVRSPRRTRGPDDGDGDGPQLAARHGERTGR